jgi:hypothetical protein
VKRTSIRLMGLAALVLGCQSTAGTDLKPPGNGGGGGTVGGGRSTDGGGSGDVRVTIVAPKAMDVIRGGSSPEIRVRVQSFLPGSNDPSGDAVDPTSVVASLRTLKDNSVATSGPLFGPMPNNEFAAPFDLSKVVSGDYQLIVTARSVGGATGMAVGQVRVDTGPAMEIVSPKESGSYKGGMGVVVTIDSSPFGPTMNVMASIAGTPLALLPSAAPNTYEAAVEFLNFPTPLQGDQVLQVSATNAAGTRTDANVRFTVDNKGPALTATEPAEGSVVGGIIRVRATVKDSAGVIGNSVVAFIGQRKEPEFKIQLKPEGDVGVFSALFDTNKLTTCKPPPDQSLCNVFPTLSFRASDLAGNESVLAYDIGVDNQPPILDLYPPPDLRVVRYDSQLKALVCSFAFDPLGNYRQLGDMPNDGCAVPQVFDLRARIEDSGNRADGLKHAPISGIDPATVGVYVLGDTSQPLVVDVDGDGACDVINPKLVPSTKGPVASNEVLTIRLAPVPPKGAADFTADPSLDDPAVLAAYPGCSQGPASLGPRRLCGSEPLTVVIGSPAARGPDPAIWTLEPITAGEPQCVGSQFDSFANQIPEGWACIATAASDRLGNASVSNPLRVWIQRRGLAQTGPSCPAPPPSAGPPPNCTGSFNRQSGALSGTPCQGRAFPARQILNEGALPEGQAP